MDSTETFDQFEAHTRSVDAEFRRVFKRFENRMQCRSGCSKCCSQMFSISLIEAAYISRAVKALPDFERRRLQKAAAGYVEEAKELTRPSEQSDDDPITPRPGLRLPCPALQGDACSIYGVRPLICRKWGIPIFNPKRPDELQACDLNFAPGEEVDIDGLIEPQVALLEEWVEIKDRTRRRLNHPTVRSTVAEAILYDYEEVLLRRSEVR